MPSLALAEGCLSLWFKELNQGGDICLQLRSNRMLSGRLEVNKMENLA